MSVSADSTEIPLPLIDTIRQAERISVLTGSGISAESGVPTFREAQTGLWAKYDPMELATPEAFKRDPDLVWGWYRWRRDLISEAQPNPGHRALVEIEKIANRFDLITQNVDGLHQLAGSSEVVEMHGNIMRSRCTVEGKEVDYEANADGDLPRCPDCGGLLRPDVVWFGESIPEIAFARAMEAASVCDVFFAIGTSGVVQPAASLAIIAEKAGATTVEINIDDTPLTSSLTYSLRASAGLILPILVESLSARSC